MSEAEPVSASTESASPKSFVIDNQNQKGAQSQTESLNSLRRIPSTKRAFKSNSSLERTKSKKVLFKSIQNQKVPSHVVPQITLNSKRPQELVSSLQLPENPLPTSSSNTSAKNESILSLDILVNPTTVSSTNTRNSSVSVIPGHRYTKTSSSYAKRSGRRRANLQNAIQEHKIFSVIGDYPGLRRALQRRGWVEKRGLGRIDFSPSSSYDEASDKVYANRVLKSYAPNFIWTENRERMRWSSMLEGTIINCHPKAEFTSKDGIKACLHDFHWYSEREVSNVYFPRCYRLCVEEEKAAFIGDFRICACMGLLKWVVGGYEKAGEAGIFESSGNGGVIPLCLDFAVLQLNHYVRCRRHDDIDELTQEDLNPRVTAEHWEFFLSQYYRVVHDKLKFVQATPEGSSSSSSSNAKSLYDSAKRALQRLAPFWPQLNIDGTSNIWIVKPGSRNRGIGIMLLSQLEKILGLLGKSNFISSNWVAQKYIERPMLIYNTKFDLRQWFIVTDWNPLTVWFYKECYVRFCSKPFTLEDLHESIHLCNNAVQCRYENSTFRDPALPKENMWDNYTFQAYLKSLDQLEVWSSVVVPGMKQGILGVLLSSQESTVSRKGCFELYGADFMLCENFHPWLIEINASPCMSATTPITQRMCPQCLEDLVKVVVDYPKDKNTDTGLFELIYQQAENHTFKTFPFGEMVIQGQKIHKDIDRPVPVTVTRSSSRAKVSRSRNKLSTSSVSKLALPNRTLTFKPSDRLKGLSLDQRPSPRVSKAKINVTARSKLALAIANSENFTNLIQRLRLRDAQRRSPPPEEPSANETTAVPTPTLSSSRLDHDREYGRLVTGSPSRVNSSTGKSKRTQNNSNKVCRIISKAQVLARAHEKAEKAHTKLQKVDSKPLGNIIEEADLNSKRFKDTETFITAEDFLEGNYSQFEKNNSNYLSNPHFVLESNDKMDQTESKDDNDDVRDSQGQVSQVQGHTKDPIGVLELGSYREPTHTLESGGSNETNDLDVDLDHATSSPAINSRN